MELSIEPCASFPLTMVGLAPLSGLTIIDRLEEIFDIPLKVPKSLFSELMARLLASVYDGALHALRQAVSALKKRIELLIPMLAIISSGNTKPTKMHHSTTGSSIRA